MDVILFQDEVLRHQKLLYHVSYAMLRNDEDCADAVQEALMSAWRHRDDLRDMASFRPWLVRILVNTCTTLMRRRAHVQLVPLDAERAQSEQPDHLALRDALDRLPADQRVATILHYLEGFSIHEIADMVQAPENTIKTRLRSARQKLHISLGEEVMIG